MPLGLYAFHTGLLYFFWHSETHRYAHSSSYWPRQARQTHGLPWVLCLSGTITLSDLWPACHFMSQTVFLQICSDSFFSGSYSQIKKIKDPNMNHTEHFLFLVLTWIVSSKSFTKRNCISIKYSFTDFPNIFQNEKCQHWAFFFLENQYIRYSTNKNSILNAEIMLWYMQSWTRLSTWQ